MLAQGSSRDKELGNKLVDKLSNRLGDKLGDNRKRMMMMLMKNNEHITINELSKKIGISTTAVERNIKYLQDKKLIERIGPAKGGSWRVLE